MQTLGFNHLNATIKAQLSKQHTQVALTFTRANLHITRIQVTVSLDLRINASENIDGESLAANCMRRAYVAPV